MSAEGFARNVRHRPSSGEDAGALRYSAFVSYNHRDRKQVAWLHRALEGYRIPRHLRGRPGPLGPLGAKLPPVFRDREELAASADLARSVQDALEQSHSLIVVCSPNSARSAWVNEEIRAFAALGRSDRIQCLIVGGKAHASSRPGEDPEQECFPPALFESGDARPLAADLRPGQDGRLAAKLKLVAGLLGVGYDELRQREQVRRTRRLTALAAGFAAGFVLMTALAGFALVSRSEAIRQRDTAERTVAFVKSLFEVYDPSESRGRTVTAREILDRGAARIELGLAREPTVQAELGTTLAEVYTKLGLLHDGDRLIQRMLAVPGVPPRTRVRQLIALGEAKAWQTDDAAAVKAFAAALALARDPRTGRTDFTPRILRGLAFSQPYLGQTAMAEANARRALQLDQRAHSPEPDIAHDLEALGLAYLLTDRFGPARDVLNQALEIRLRLQGAEHPRAIEDLNSLGYAAYMQQDSVSAEQLWRRTLAVKERVFGANHTEVAVALNNVGLVMVERREYAAAEPLLRRAVDINLAQREATSTELVFPYTNLGLALRGRGDARAGEAAFEKGLAAARLHQHRNLAPLLVDLADVDCERGDTARGLARLAEAAPLMAAAYPKEPWRSAWVEVIRGGCFLKAGRRGEARSQFSQAAPVMRARWAPDSHYGHRTAELLQAAR
jgi:tetratricopeptide (TPR) repeat protein